MKTLKLTAGLLLMLLLLLGSLPQAMAQQIPCPSCARVGGKFVNWRWVRCDNCKGDGMIDIGEIVDNLRLSERERLDHWKTKVQWEVTVRNGVAVYREWNVRNFGKRLDQELRNPPRWYNINEHGRLTLKLTNVVQAHGIMCMNELHVVVVTRDGGVWHALRQSNGRWRGFGNVKAQSGDPGFVVGLAAHQHPDLLARGFYHGPLHSSAWGLRFNVVVGSSRRHFYTRREPNSWSRFREVGR